MVVNRPGQEYNSPPELIVNGVGEGAKLTPRLSNGTITGVEIISAGVGYGSSTTTIQIVPVVKMLSLQLKYKPGRLIELRKMKII